MGGDGGSALLQAQDGQLHRAIFSQCLFHLHNGGGSQVLRHGSVLLQLAVGKRHLVKVRDLVNPVILVISA